ncbi:MAG: nitrous oxide reductase family maturation protein NosD [Methylacidiphilaceae bacterium]|nr:nitrous oxide reductase family maturation protein NosD [Candidatus Methylacidiphilaceae bacterium]
MRSPRFLYLTALVSAAIGWLLFPFAALARDWIVSPKAGDFATLRAALNAAQAGDRILIRAGLYQEGPLLVKRPIVLQGEGWPVIDGEKREEMLRIESDGVRVSGIVFQNSGQSYSIDIAAVKLLKGKNCQIAGNRFLDNFFAIYCASAVDCVIEDNEILGHAVSEGGSGNGIHLWSCQRMTIRGNHVRGHRDGLYFEFVTDSLAEGNQSIGNLRYGLHFMFSKNNVYRNNLFEGNGAGVAVMFSKEILIEGNLFRNNWGPTSYGLLLKSIDDSVIRHNLFVRDTTAIRFDEANRNRIEENDFVANGKAFELFSDSSDNVIEGNNLQENVFEATSNSLTAVPARFSHNYWSSYRGFDLNRDGIGDVPYRPVRLFASLIETTPCISLLIGSLFQETLDFVEDLFPTLIPAMLVDPEPSMTRIPWSK